MSDEVVATDRELTHCPECGSVLSSGSMQKFQDLRVLAIWCEDCSFRASEEWVIDRTIRKKSIESVDVTDS